MLQKIAVSVDPSTPMKGDVVIIKRTYFNPDVPQKLSTICTRCDGSFPTELRRMQSLDEGGKRSVEVRNIPQCKTCRGRYARAPKHALVPLAEPKQLLARNPIFAKGQTLHRIETDCAAEVLEDFFGEGDVRVHWRCEHIRAPATARPEVFAEGQ